MNITQENIENLTSLWKEVALATGNYIVSESIAIATVAKGQWPNRIWYQNNNDIPIKKISHWLQDNTVPLTYAYFNEGEYENNYDFSSFQLKSSQYGMSLLLDKKWDITSRVMFQKIEDDNSIAIWTTNFEKAFGYPILPEILQKMKDKLSFFNIVFEGQPVGTVALYITQTIAGIHCLGVVPEMRGKGFAREIMQFVLEIAQNKGATIAVLQASEMAKELYFSMGFQLDFMLHNFVRK
ncbi:GNAT family N-acetyltransferase [Flavobacterium sp. J27]|uniref:GNAT family N-acetyltransferase n=1 Tax=Flavobacterium sp. J27 TaxID=2060419 RepID=UPI0010316A37|nr:GNAT family N-acetyltransferase [Flavobacterium sp. J27]